MIKKLPPFLKNKYSIALLVFLVWIMFFDRNRMINQYRLVRTLNKMKYQKTYYEKEIKKDSIALSILESDKEALEKFAREKYLMKKDNEDIFLIIQKDD